LVRGSSRTPTALRRLTEKPYTYHIGMWATSYIQKNASVLAALGLRAVTPTVLANARRLVPQRVYSDKFRQGLGIGLSGLDPTWKYRRSVQSAISPLATGLVDHEVGRALGSAIKDLPQAKNPSVVKALYTNSVPGMSRSQARELRKTVHRQLPKGTNLPLMMNKFRHSKPESFLGRTIQDVARNPLPIPIPTKGRTGNLTQKGTSLLPTAAMGALDPFGPLTWAGVHLVAGLPDMLGVTAANRGATKTLQALKEKLVLQGMRNPLRTRGQKIVDAAQTFIDPMIPETKAFGRDVSNAVGNDLHRFLHEPNVSSAISADTKTLLSKR